MKTTREKNSNVFSGQAQEKIDFTVSSKNVNKIINILRSSMYKEPSRAVVREILANALDIHKQTGTSKKIDSILIEWPDNKIQKILNPKINKLHKIKKDKNQ